MDSSRKILEKIIGSALSGKGSHVATKTLLDGLGWKAAGACPPGAPHSVFQIVNHMSYWQNWAAEWLDGADPPVPEHAAGGWPGDVAPANAAEWRQAVRSFRAGLTRLERQSRKDDLLATRGEHTRLGMLLAIAGHNSHHAGQIVLLRQMLGSWPPPSGGVTW